MSEPAKKLLALVWAMRYEWIASVILVYVIVRGESLFWIAVGVGLLLALRPVSVMLFRKAIAARGRSEPRCKLCRDTGWFWAIGPNGDERRSPCVCNCDMLIPDPLADQGSKQP